MKRFLSLALVVMTSCTSTLESRMDALLELLFPANEPGAAVLVMQGDSILFDKGYGLARLSNSTEENCGDTPFNIASVSKQFTAVGVLQLVQEGKVSLEDPVTKYFPEYTHPIWNDIRIKHLLAHSSGIPDERGYLTREQKVQGDEALAVEYLQTLDHLNFAPGSAYEYMNPTFVLCGYLIERVTGQEFTSYMKEHVFGPAGMDKTYYFDRNREDPKAAHGYVQIEGLPHSWIEYDFGEETFFATRPDGGIYTSTHEFVKWERALREGCVVAPELLQEAFTPHTLITGSPWSDYQNRPNTWYGYGWFIEPATESAPLRIYHTGDNGGFKIMAARYPEKDLLILVFANRADWDRYSLLMKIERAIKM